MAEAAARALGVPLAAVEDFFTAGGTSLGATTWAAELAAAGISASLRDLFEERTPQAVAAIAEREAACVPPGDSATFVGRLRMTARQRRYTRVYLPRGNRNWATMTSGVPLSEENTADAAVNELIARHDSFRAIVDTSEGEQVFLPAAQCTLAPMEQLTAREWEGVVSAPIDVGWWPPHRWAIVDGELRWVIHHLFSDGHSQSVLRLELGTLLTGRALPPRAGLSYADFSLVEPRPDRDSWWEEQLRDPPQLPVHLDARHAQQGAWRAVRPIPDSLLAAGRTRGITPFQGAMLGLFAGLMERTGREDVIIGMPGHGRTVPGVEDTVGNFISLVLVRLRTGELVPSILQDRLLGALEHQDYRFDRVMDDLDQEECEDRFPVTVSSTLRNWIRC